jgi:hypothetical protein
VTAPDDPGSPPRTGTLWCPGCGAAAEYPEDAVLAFARSLDWPRCCGQTMSVARPVHRLGSRGQGAAGRDVETAGDVV